MTKAGGRLTEVAGAHLCQRLAERTDPKAIRRLVAALEYKNGLSPAKIEETYSWPKRTIYRWLNRFEERGLKAALRDELRLGRRPLLNSSHRRQLIAALDAPPTEAGYDALAWTPALVNTYLDECFEVTYSGEHCRRLLHEARNTVAEVTYESQTSLIGRPLQFVRCSPELPPRLFWSLPRSPS